MVRVHWSVWGFVGFFGMVLIGLWVDSRWMPGVGHAPVTSTSLITQVHEHAGAAVAARPSSRGDAPPPRTGVVEPMEAGTYPTATLAAPVEAVGLSAPGIFSDDLDIPFGDTSDHVERLPDPETVEHSSALDEPVDLSNPLGLRRIGLEGDKPPRAKAAAADVPSDPAISEIIEGSSPVLRSVEFAGDAASRAEYLREVQRLIQEKMRDDRAATPRPLTYDRLAQSDQFPPPRPPMAVPASFPAELADTAAPSKLPADAAPAEMPTAQEAPSYEQVERLREAALQLDQIANDLERHNLYRRADQVRAAAQKLRLDARKAPQPSRGPAPSVLTMPPR